MHFIEFNLEATMQTDGKRTLLVAAFLAAIAGSTIAADKAAFDWKACSAEVEKFCKAVKGDDNIYAYLEKHDDQLSKTCDATQQVRRDGWQEEKIAVSSTRGCPLP
ncbi:MAG: hypothetical protein JNM52_05290 [Betaproteobacteria bacterium]|nr:hypothetical protein [Betaproteobacteria bacterium]